MRISYDLLALVPISRAKFGFKRETSKISRSARACYFRLEVSFYVSTFVPVAFRVLLSSSRLNVINLSDPNEPLLFKFIDATRER